MKPNIKKTSLFPLAVIFAFVLLYAFTTHPQQTYRPVSHSQWKNLKVLPKNITKDSLMGLMKGYSASLGVKCIFCHVPDKNNPKELDFVSDSKMEKEIARGMIMMTDDINAKYFLPHKPDPKPTQAHDVSCITCHRGSTNPTEYLQGVSSAIYVPEKK